MGLDAFAGAESGKIGGQKHRENGHSRPPAGPGLTAKPGQLRRGRLPWKPDVVFREDRQRIRLDNGPLNLATARKLALQALHQAQDANSTRNRRKMAGWDDEYLRAVLAKMAPI